MIIDQKISLFKSFVYYIKNHPAEALLNVLFIVLLFDLDSTLEDLDEQLEAAE